MNNFCKDCGKEIANYYAKRCGSCAHKKMWQNPSYKKRMTTAIKKSLQDPVTRKKISISHKKLWQDLDYRKKRSGQNKVEKTCPTCHKKFACWPGEYQKRKFCSIKCVRRANEVKEQNRKAKLAEKNPMWKGDRVGIDALHVWVTKRKPKPIKCEECKKNPPLDLANFGGYDRDLKHWRWLCRHCHMKLDGRLKTLATWQR